MKTLALLALLLLSACKSIVYADPSGRRVTYSNLGFDTTIGTLTLKAPDGATVTLQNYNAKDEAFLAALNAAIAKIPAIPIVP